MSFDGLAEQSAILERTRTLNGGRVLAEIPDDTELERYADTKAIKPYIVVSFGELYDSVVDRSITGEEQQPAIMPVVWECWSPVEEDVRALAGAVRTLFRGWADGDNMSPLRFRGGGAFVRRDSQGAPSRFQRTVTMETLLNMSFQPDGPPIIL